MSRITTRILLGLALLLAIVVIAVMLYRSASDIVTVGAAIAGALAVITAVISAWGAQRVVELEEDRRKPYPYPSFDFSSRYGFVLFRVENSGGSAAHNISLKWDSDPLNSDGKEIRFSPNSKEIQISVLLPGQAISKTVNSHIDFFKDERVHQYEGTILFKDPSGKKYSHRFRMDAEMYLGTPTHTDEALKTHYELQKIPNRLKGIELELKQIRRQAEGG